MKYFSTLAEYDSSGNFLPKDAKMALKPDEIARVLAPYETLYTAIETKTNPAEPLLLTHYTSVQVVEQILRNDEVWFANPLYMNDLGEMRVGIVLGNRIFPEFAQQAGGTPERATRLQQAYDHYLNHLTAEAALDTYVFCLSEHPHGDTDGRLSMWREYGSKGNGAALVINTQRISYRADNPIIIAKVAYRTEHEREHVLRTGLENWAELTQAANLPDDQLYLSAHAAFGFVKSLALATKHIGFREENEWRAIYVPERDPLGYLKSCLHYFVGPRGLEPKFKYKFGRTYDAQPPNSGLALDAGDLTDLLEFILLGPTVSSPLAKAAFVRMLEHNGKPAFGDRVFSSTIPLRPISY